MIKAEAHMETGAVELHVNGSLKEILVEVTMLLNGIYATYAKENPKTAQVFRRALVWAMADSEMISGPVSPITSLSTLPR